MGKQIDTGGPAFPVLIENDRSDCATTLRDYFAAKAMQAIIAKSPHGVATSGDLESTEKLMEALYQAAVGAYAYADAMLLARKAGQS